MSAVFDRFMVSNSIGTNRKLRRLPVVQRWTYVAGILALASQSPIRGTLLITDGEPVTAEDLAEEATVKVADARAALESFRKLGMLDRDEHGIEWVHDWDVMNKDPKPSDSPDATRARKRAQRERDKAARGGVTSRGCHAPEEEEEGEVETPPAPQGGNGAVAPLKPKGNRKSDHSSYLAEMDAWCGEHFPSGEPDAVSAAVSWLQPRTDHPVTVDDVRALCASNPVWSAQLGLTSSTERGAA